MVTIRDLQMIFRSIHVTCAYVCDVSIHVTRAYVCDV